MAIWLALIAVGGTAITGGVGWLIARHNSSGSIRTSEASTLWAESQTIRAELRAEAAAMRAEAAETRRRLEETTESLRRVSWEARDCHLETVELKARLAALELRR